MDWEQAAREVCSEITDLDPLDRRTSSARIMLGIAALKGLITAPGCPESYRDQVTNLALKEKWEPDVQKAHLLLASLCGCEGVDTYYGRYG